MHPNAFSTQPGEPHVETSTQIGVSVLLRPPTAYLRSPPGYSDLEVTLWFEHLCCGLLSPEADTRPQRARLSGDPARRGAVPRMTSTQQKVLMKIAGFYTVPFIGRCRVAYTFST